MKNTTNRIWTGKRSEEKNPDSERNQNPRPRWERKATLLQKNKGKRRIVRIHKRTQGYHQD